LRKIAAWFASLIVCLSVTSPASAVEVVPAISSPAPATTATAAVVMDARTNRVLYSLNPDAKMAMASTTKIMTAIVAIENGMLDATVSVSKNAHGMEGSSIYLDQGEKLKLKDLLYGLMLQSGNDAAVAIAEHISGSTDAFCALMNEKARLIGARNTHFTNPHGLQDSGHFTTAYDLALISAYAMRNPVFCQIVSTKYKKIPRETKDTDRVLKNKNKILWQYEGGNGIKTGFTKDSGKCFVSAALRNGMQLVCVVLRCPQMFPDSMKLMDYCFYKYKLERIIEAGKYAGFVQVRNGLKKGLHVYCDEDFFYPLTEEEKSRIEVRVRLEDVLSAPVFTGTLLGQLEVSLGGKIIFSAGLYASEQINQDTFLHYIEEIIQGWRRFSPILGIPDPAAE
jgi:serine-type D-Ala-D-Ala carboxypeptidase (penicillin-binding protein 5/6)